MTGHIVTIEPSEGPAFQTYLVGDDKPKQPAIVIFGPIFGVDDDVKRVADRWAQRGYLVAAPDYYARVKPGVLDRSEESRKRAMERWKALNVDAVMADMAALKAYLQASPACNGTMLSIGICAGGELAFLAATRLDFEGVATFHATHVDRHLDEASKVKGRLTLHYGGDDSLVPLEKVDTIRTCFAGNSRVDIHVYEGASHGFSFEGRPPYHELAAISSDRRAQEVFDQICRA